MIIGTKNNPPYNYSIFYSKCKHIKMIGIYNFAIKTVILCMYTEKLYKNNGISLKKNIYSDTINIFYEFINFRNEGIYYEIC